MDTDQALRMAAEVLLAVAAASMVVAEAASIVVAEVAPMVAEEEGAADLMETCRSATRKATRGAANPTRTLPTPAASETRTQ